MAENTQPNLDVRQGKVQGQVGGPPREDQQEFNLHETRLETDEVITDHNDPRGTQYQFLGVEPNAPLPIGGAEHDPRTPDEVFAGVSKPGDAKPRQTGVASDAKS